jgi:hypothetical protein
MSRAWIIALALGLGGWTSSLASTLAVYAPPPVPQIYAWHNDDFTVRVRSPGGEWQDLYEYRIRVDWDRPQDASLVYFDFTGAVEIEVQKNNGAFGAVSVAPLSAGLKPERSGAVVRLRLTRPQSFSLQFDDDRLHNLHILAGAPPPPRPGGPNVVYFGPGVHTPPDKTSAFPVKSGDTVYLDGGAILKGAFVLDGLHDVTILGRGLLYNPGQAIEINGAHNIHVSDLILANDETQPAARVANIRESANVFLVGISGFTAGKWSDGINISTARHVRVDRSYLRTSDDAVVVYAVADCPICKAQPGKAPAPPRAGSLDTRDIRITNSVLWTDVAHAMYVGHFGDNAVPRTIEGVTFDNIDVANLDEDDPAWEGAMAIFSGDATRIRDITFSNIRIDRIEEGKLINIVAGNSPRYNTAPGRGVENVTLRDITFTGDGLASFSQIQGASDATAVRGVLIENLVIGGRRVTPNDLGGLKIGPFVSGLTIR